jgi:hypothetical protein
MCRFASPLQLKVTRVHCKVSFFAVKGTTGCQPVDAAVGETSNGLHQIQVSLDNQKIKNFLYTVVSFLLLILSSLP